MVGVFTGVVIVMLVVVSMLVVLVVMMLLWWKKKIMKLNVAANDMDSSIPKYNPCKIKKKKKKKKYIYIYITHYCWVFVLLFIPRPQHITIKKENKSNFPLCSSFHMPKSLLLPES